MYFSLKFLYFYSITEHESVIIQTGPVNLATQCNIVTEVRTDPLLCSEELQRSCDWLIKHAPSCLNKRKILLDKITTLQYVLFKMMKIIYKENESTSWIGTPKVDPMTSLRKQPTFLLRSRPEGRFARALGLWVKKDGCFRRLPYLDGVFLK